MDGFRAARRGFSPLLLVGCANLGGLSGGGGDGGHEALATRDATDAPRDDAARDSPSDVATVRSADALRDSLVHESSGATEGGPRDAPREAIADAADLSNLLQNPSFETTVGLGCEPNWQVTLGTAQASTLGRGDHGSCMVCSTGAGVPPTALLQPGFAWTSPDGGTGTVVAAAWIRAVPDAGPVDGGPAWALADLSTSAAGDQNGSMVIAGPTWQPSTVSWPAKGERFGFSVYVRPPGACVLVDDVAFYLVPPH